MKNDYKLGDAILITIIICFIMLFFDSCGENDNKQTSIPNIGYHSDYWYDREHAKEKAKARYENRQTEIRNGKQVPINKS